MRAKIVVIGNEKGGTGKSTLAMHLAVLWLRQGKKVVTMDLDGRQGTLSKYLENRKAFATRRQIDLPMPEHVRMSNISNEVLFLRAQLDRLRNDFDVIILDTPGADTALSSEAIFQADLLVTPINDSLVDLDVLASIDPQSMTLRGPSHYTERLFSVSQKRNLMQKTPLRWYVVRNRMSPFKNKNRQAIDALMPQLASKLKFTLLPNLTERIIFRELFLNGLTMLDLRENGLHYPLSMSHLAARQEVRALACQLPLT
ncbi:MAG: AAA family ATPase [Alphaproteobacteria bacterium]|nr:AAA family ATPase [Alphaproteobacteria bacterium]